MVNYLLYIIDMENRLVGKNYSRLVNLTATVNLTLLGWPFPTAWGNIGEGYDETIRVGNRSDDFDGNIVNPNRCHLSKCRCSVADVYTGRLGGFHPGYIPNGWTNRNYMVIG